MLNIRSQKMDFPDYIKKIETSDKKGKKDKKGEKKFIQIGKKTKKNQMKFKYLLPTYDELQDTFDELFEETKRVTKLMVYQFYVLTV